MKYNKLIRDNIPEIIASKGRNAIVHTADEKEYWEKLKEKLAEEVKEFIDAESLEELADIIEVIDAMMAYKKFSREELANVQDKKRTERGGFKKRIILDES